MSRMNGKTEERWQYPDETLDGGKIIKLDSDLGKELGFTSDKFDEFSYLSTSPGKDTEMAIYISMIESKNPGRGHFKTLVKNILERGWMVKVPTPLPRMEAVLKHMGFKRTVEYSEFMEESVEVYIKR